MVWNEIVSAICICCSAAIFSLSLQGQTKIKILFIQMFASFLYLASYLFVLNINTAATIGAITAGFEILRLVAFFFIEKSEKFNTKKWNLLAAGIFSVVLTVCTIITWGGWISIFPLLSAILVSIALGSKNLIFIKLAFVIQSVCITTYLLLLSLLINAISQMFVFVSSIVGLITFIIKTKKENQKTKNANEESAS